MLISYITLYNQYTKGDEIMLKVFQALTTKNTQMMTWKKYYYEIVKAIIIYK